MITDIPDNKMDDIELILRRHFVDTFIDPSTYVPIQRKTRNRVELSDTSADIHNYLYQYGLVEFEIQHKTGATFVYTLTEEGENLLSFFRL